MKYSEKLRDPRWQKKRLEILERDNWTCRVCLGKENTLHVHHIDYFRGDPWETPANLLVTLCEECHEAEREQWGENSNLLLKELKANGFMSDDLLALIDFGSNVIGKLGKDKCLFILWDIATKEYRAAAEKSGKTREFPVKKEG